MSRTRTHLLLALLVVALAGGSAEAGTFTYELTSILGTTRLDGPQPYYPLDLGTRFTTIRSMTMHIVGHIHSGTTAPAQLIVGIANWRDGARVNILGFGPYMVDYAFDLTHTWYPGGFPGNEQYYTQFLQSLCDNNAQYYVKVFMEDGSVNPYGYGSLSTATITIDGDPVPEPSSLLALSLGVTGLVARRRKKGC